jgi:hypothetical protein
MTRCCLLFDPVLARLRGVYFSLRNSSPKEAAVFAVAWILEIEFAGCPYFSSIVRKH